jgi:hypothetical protein
MGPQMLVFAALAYLKILDRLSRPAENPGFST